MKKYILGNYELNIADVYLLKICIKNHIKEIEKYMDFLNQESSRELIQLYKIELDKLNLILEQLERFED